MTGNLTDTKLMKSGTEMCLLFSSQQCPTWYDEVLTRKYAWSRILEEGVLTVEVIKVNFTI